MAVIAGAIALMAAGLAAYPRIPSALFGQPIRQPRGIERITRHTFFAGVRMLGLGHALLATRLVGAVFALGLALVAIVGARHQDAKFLARRGQAYEEYVSATSAIPFAALLAGRQRLIWRELPLRALLGGLGIALLLRAGHAGLFRRGRKLDRPRRGRRSRGRDLPELAPRAAPGRHPSRAASIGMRDRQIVSMEVHE